MIKKGSQWFKWDLQVATNKYTHYEGITLDSQKATELSELTSLSVSQINSDHSSLNNEQYAKLFVEYILNCTDLSAVAIMNHNTGDGIQEILDYLCAKQVEFPNSHYTRLKIFPGVEIGCSDRCHMLIMFNDQTTSKNKFLYDQNGKVIGEKKWDQYIEEFLNAAQIPNPRFVNRQPSNSSNLGVIDLLNLADDWDFIPIMPHIANSDGWWKELQVSNRKETYLHKKFGIVDSKTIKNNEDLKRILDGQHPEWNKKPVAQIHTSDARKLSLIGTPFTWIKALPTFHGLRQVIYEPKTRVRIQEDKPEQKQLYQTIDKVNFKSENDMFSNDTIEVNDKLNSIIGGKSSGKSLLLYYIAKTIDPVQVSKRLKEMNIDEPYDFESNGQFGFEVTWCDGVKYRLNDGEERSRQITYIPQMYINHIAEHRGDSELDNLVLSILNEREEFRKFFDEQRLQIAAAKADTASQVIRFFQHKVSIEEKEKVIRSRGDKLARETNLQTKTNELAELRVESNFTAEDERAYNLANTGRQINEARLLKLQSLENTIKGDYTNTINALESNSDKLFSSLLVTINNRFNNDSLVRGFLSKLVTRDSAHVKDTLIVIKDRLGKDILRVQRLISRVEARINYFNELLTPYLGKITKKEKLSQLQDIIRSEENELNLIKILEQEKAGLEGLLNETKSAIINDYTRVLIGYQRMAAKVNNEYNVISTEKSIQLKAVIGFDKERFAQSCTLHIDKRRLLKTDTGNYFDDENHYIFAEASHLTNIADFFEKVLSDSVSFNQSGSQPVVCERMFDDYFSIHFELYEKDESIFKMSPGKKGLILMFLILHLSNATYPILIDQPEDNLDNRTVYSELKEFIKSKKIDRQILMVTHNANLVVPTDSENVIVANQSGQDASKDNEIYQFEYVTGALENTFNDETANGILHQMGIREHVCDILEGGEQAFKERELRYSIA
jgi:ABC-type cobalamin/Fe3+-siderophores transport system ATPase subunit